MKPDTAEKVNTHFYMFSREKSYRVQVILLTYIHAYFIMVLRLYLKIQVIFRYIPVSNLVSNGPTSKPPEKQ